MNHLFLATAILGGALLLDLLLGEPRRFHPLIGFGRLVNGVERKLNDSALVPWVSRLRGLLGIALLALPLPLLLFWLLPKLPSGLTVAIELIGLYLCLGRQSLAQHARNIAKPLSVGDFDQARLQTSYIVSRDPARLDSPGMSRAAIESVLENGNDACFATLFWFLIGGLPLALLHRLANTLDAMWGYRNARYRDFGWAAARFDDLLGWLPARLTALSYALCGNFSGGMRCWRQQAPQHDSPNAGPVMAAGAGALGIRLGGAAWYGDQLKPRPEFGCDQPADPVGIERSILLVNRSCWLWIALLTVTSVLIAWLG
ncbi:adenosylcobinamide-phosphate synthase CbiB [Motiliproteus coralliicola]|uniref:adenosylcobinamide-phosphate synthase CbiB n=1 Tax=Motiliproteus coralliicola TaxID=2283196 RepID=UPI00311DDC48